MAKVGTSAREICAILASHGFEPYGDGIRLRPDDLESIDQLNAIVDDEVLSRLDS